MKTISEQVYDEVNRLKKERYSQADIARMMNISQQMVSLIINGERPCGRLRLETVDRMFPNGTIVFYGNTTVGDNSTVTNSFNRTEDKSLVDSIMNEIMSDEIMDDKSKVRAYAILLKYKENK